LRGATAPAGREGRDPHGRARPVRLVRELRAALPRLGRHPGGVEPARRDGADVPRRLRHREVRTGCEAVAISPKKKTVDLRDVKTGEGDDRVSTTSCAVARRGPDPPAAARDRPARHLLGADRPRRPTIRQWLPPGRGDEDRNGLVHRAPDGDESRSARWWSAAASSAWRWSRISPTSARR